MSLGAVGTHPQVRPNTVKVNVTILFLGATCNAVVATAPLVASFRVFW